MTDDIVDRLGPCGDGHGEMIEVSGLDSTHMGYALSLMKARWGSDEDTLRLITGAVPNDELIRSAVEFLLSLAMSASAGTYDNDTTVEERGLMDRQAAAASLRHTMATYHRKGRNRMARLCEDIATNIEKPRGAVNSVILHAIDVSSILDLCAAIITSVEVTRGVKVEDQFSAYEQVIAYSIGNRQRPA